MTAGAVADEAWVPCETGHALSIREGKIVVRSPKGKELASVPAAVRKTQAFDDLDALLSFLHVHDAEAGAQVERWLLRSLPVPRALVTQVWADQAWRSWLTDLVVATEDGSVAGLLRDVGPAGLRVVDLDGETVTLDPEAVRIPHPVLLDDLDGLRELAAELGVTQRFDQLFRAVRRRGAEVSTGATELTDWAGGRFEQQRHATSRASSGGFAVSGGYATTTVHEGGQSVIARFWVGADAPDVETITGELHWVSGDKPLPVVDVGPVAFSEGVRMATHIYAGRTQDKGAQR